MGYIGGELAPLFDPDLAVEAVHDMADAGTDKLFEFVVENTPVSYHRVALEHQGFGHEFSRTPGTLKRSWKRGPVTRTRDGVASGYGGEVWTDDPIAPYVEWNTKPHAITPKKAKALRFRTWPTGELVFARLVKHPGTTGQHMMGLAVHRATLEFPLIVNRPLHAWAEKAAIKAHQPSPITLTGF